MLLRLWHVRQVGPHHAAMTRRLAASPWEHDPLNSPEYRQGIARTLKVDGLLRRA